ncbi:MAG TPA: ABC transporter substrate-binding protein [Pyrinomonadaceae bacterium]|jgi:branched-chain amino acid transport system substrate-binding protein|nr:ABC transporter substrate-binding protein [Pyrinomonadaceae bacterium]
MKDEVKANSFSFRLPPSAFRLAFPRTLTLAALLVVTLLASYFCGCGHQRSDVVVKPADEKLRLGAFMSLTGDTAQYGISALNGIRMAVEEANAGGGVAGHRVELITQDTRSDPGETETVVRRLAEESHVQALIGEVVSSRSLAAARVAQDVRVPMLTPSATSPEVTAQGDYVFRSCYTDSFQGAALARFAARELHARRAAVLLDPAQRYSVELARFIREAFERHGGEIVSEQEYREGGADFSAQLSEVAAVHPDVIFIPGYYLEAGQLARQAKELGITAPLVGGDGWDSPRLYEIGGQALAGDFFSSHFSADDPDPQVQRFVSDYRRLFGNAPDSFAATAYDATRIMLDAAARAHTLERAAIRDALAETRGFPGVTGNVTFNAERNAVKSVVIIRIGDNGKQSVEGHITPTDITPTPTPTPAPTPQKRRRR